jgi:trigger factor
LKVTTESLENRQLAVTIEVEEERARQGMQRAARNIAKEVRIPGYRRGKAPLDVIVQRFGETTVRREAADLLAEDVVRDALTEEGIDAYAPGELTEITLDPITYKLTVPLVPIVDLGDYRAYRLEPPVAEVADEQVEEALESIREENTIFESVERPAVWDDGISLDLRAQTDDGTEVLNGEDLHIVLEAGSTDPVPGFPEAIEGMSPGEERTFKLTLPPDFPQEEHAGKDAEFTVKINEVYNQIIPAIDDDLARTVGSYESLDELKAEIRDRLRAATQAQQDRQYAGEVVAAIVEQATIEYPPVVLERELDQVVSEAERSVTSQRRLSMEDYLRMEGKTKEEFRQDLVPPAQARVAQSLVLAEVVKLEGLQISSEEIEAGIEQASASWGSRSEVVRKSFQSEAGLRAMANRLLTDKALQRLVAIAKGEAEAAALDDSADAADAEPASEAVPQTPEPEVAEDAQAQDLNFDPTDISEVGEQEGDVGEPTAEAAEGNGTTVASQAEDSTSGEVDG